MDSLIHWLWVDGHNWWSFKQYFLPEPMTSRQLLYPGKTLIIDNGASSFTERDCNLVSRPFQLWSRSRKVEASGNEVGRTETLCDSSSRWSDKVAWIEPHLARCCCRQRALGTCFLSGVSCTTFGIGAETKQSGGEEGGGGGEEGAGEGSKHVNKWEK